MIIEIKDLSKSYGQKTIINKVSLKINTGEFVSIVGPSGSGVRAVVGVVTYTDRIVLEDDNEDIKAGVAITLYNSSSVESGGQPTIQQRLTLLRREWPSRMNNVAASSGDSPV